METWWLCKLHWVGWDLAQAISVSQTGILLPLVEAKCDHIIYLPNWDTFESEQRLTLSHQEITDDLGDSLGQTEQCPS